MIRGTIPAPEACAQCPLAIDGKPPNPVKGIGPENPLFIVLGEGPNAFDAKEGVPFANISPAGKLLNRALGACGVKREEVYIANAALCSPRNHKTRDKDIAKAIKCCKQRLVDELDRFPQAPIVTLGKYAAESMLSEHPLLKATATAIPEEPSPDEAPKPLEILPPEGAPEDWVPLDEPLEDKKKKKPKKPKAPKKKKWSLNAIAGAHFVVPEGDYDRNVIPTLHPAMLQRSDKAQGGAHDSGLLYWLLVYDIQKVKNLAQGKLVPFSINIDFEYLDGVRALRLVQDLAVEIRAAKFFATDDETKGVEAGRCEEHASCDGHSALQSHRARLKCVGLATTERAIAVAWDILPSEGKGIIAALLADVTIVKAMHNRVYDTVVDEVNGMPVRGRIECTQLAHHSAFPGLPHKLQRVASQIFLVRPWKSEFRDGDETPQELLEYCAQDTLATARLVAPLKSRVTKVGGDKTYEMDLRKAAFATHMQLAGLPISQERNQILYDHFKVIIDRCQKGLEARFEEEGFKELFFEAAAMEYAKTVRLKDVGDIEQRTVVRKQEFIKKWIKEGARLNLDATVQIVAYLRACGVPLTQVTEKGKTTTKAAVLETLITHKPVEEILDYRGAETLFSNNIAPMATEVDRDWRWHPVWSPNKITGRYGSSPNAQNLTSGDIDGPTTWAGWLSSDRSKRPNIRRQIVAPIGRKLIEADFAQLEARVVALLSGDPWLCSAFLNGLDIHSEVAREVFPGFDNFPKDKRKSHRHVTKRFVYGFSYGADPKTTQAALAQEGYKVPIQVVQKVYAFLLKKMPGVTTFYAALIAKVKREGKVSSFLYGRSRYFPLGDPEEPTIKNHTCQSSGSDVADTGILAAFDELVGSADATTKYGVCKFLMHGHDATLVECDDAKVEIVGKVLQEKMEQTYTVDGVTMRFTVELKIGESWGGA